MDAVSSLQSNQTNGRFQRDLVVNVNTRRETIRRVHCSDGDSSLTSAARLTASPGSRPPLLKRRHSNSLLWTPFSLHRKGGHRPSLTLLRHFTGNKLHYC